MDQRITPPRPPRRSLTISCDNCAMQCTSHCDVCVVSFVVRSEQTPAHGTPPLLLDQHAAEVIRLLARAGLVPELRYELAG